MTPKFDIPKRQKVEIFMTDVTDVIQSKMKTQWFELDFEGISVQQASIVSTQHVNFLHEANPG